MSTWCPNKFGWNSLKEFGNKVYDFYQNMYFAPKNCFFRLFSWTAKMKMAFLSNLSYVVIYLVNCLKLEKSCFKIHFQFCSFQKRLKKQYFGAKYKLFCKRCLLRSQSFLSWFQTCWDTWYIFNSSSLYSGFTNF